MKPYYDQDGITIHHGDCRDVLRSLPDGIVRTCVTSPPYFGLRDYGTAEWQGGDQACDHKQESPRWNGPKQTTAQVSGHASMAERNGRSVCHKCGAIAADRQIGLEQSPEAYVSEMVSVFREVRRVLADDGTLWLNIGDSFNVYNGNRGKSTSFQSATEDACPELPGGFGLTVKSLKPKDLIGIPWMVAFALRADGWYLRQWMPWVKRNPMPESVTDRPTSACELVFLLSKSERYFYDYESVRRKMAPTSHDRLNQDIESQAGSQRANGGAKTNGSMKAVRGDKQRGHSRRHAGFNDRWDAMPQDEQCGERAFRNTDLFYQSLDAPHGVIGNNTEFIALDVPTRPYSGAHFATFPPNLIEPCVKAGSAPGDIVLDPFNGSGTTGEVAQKWGRRYIGIELNRDYIELSKRRFIDRPLFASGGVA